MTAADFLDFDEQFATPAQWAAMYRLCALQVVPAKSPQAGPNWKRPSLPEWKTLQDELAPSTSFERWYGPEGAYRSVVNMGLLTGLASQGVFCVDLDEKPGSQAASWWAGLLAVHANDMEPETPAQRTGGGGRQVLVLEPPGWASPTFKTPIGIDIRGRGGFMMAPPSMHESGRAYAWEPGRTPWEQPVEQAPEWLIEAIEKLREEHGGARCEASSRPSAEPVLTGFGRRLDGREEYMQRVVWGVAVDLRRAHLDEADPPFPADSQAERDRGWQTYLAGVETRLPARPNHSRADLLDIEGRGWSEYVRKWGRALHQWNGRLLQAAQVGNPNQKQESTAPPGDEQEPEANDNATDEIDAVDFDGELPPPRPWAFGKLLLRRAVSALIAPPGTGKTTWAAQLAVAFATGRKLGPLKPVRTGPAWVWNNEDDRHELNRRTLAACYAADIEPAALSGKLYLNTGAERALIVAREDKRSGALIATPDVAAVVEVIRRRGIKLLVVDPFAETYLATEASNDAMKQVAGLYRQIAWQGDCSVLLVAHTPKGTNADNSAGNLDAFRGGGSIGGVVRSAVTLFEMTKVDAKEWGVPADARHLYVRLDDAKANMSLKSGQPTWWRKEAIALDNGTETDPGDYVGVLEHIELQRVKEGDEAEVEASICNEVEQLAAEIVRVCVVHGRTSPDMAIALDALATSLDPSRAGMRKSKAKTMIASRMAEGFEAAGHRIIVTNEPRGRLVYQRVHVERIGALDAAA